MWLKISVLGFTKLGSLGEVTGVIERYDISKRTVFNGVSYLHFNVFNTEIDVDNLISVDLLGEDTSNIYFFNCCLHFVFR